MHRVTTLDYNTRRTTGAAAPARARMTENLLQSLPSTPLQLELTTHSYDSNDENMETDSSSSPSQYSNAVLPPFVSDDFYFNDVKRYYKSIRTKQLSLSYLMTVGAKALVLVEAIESSIQSAPNTSTTMEDDAGCVGGDSMFTLTLRPSSRSSGSKVSQQSSFTVPNLQ